ncbi:hypothetical protein C1N74_03960 [Microbacterium sp. SGAir0570]|nr:hypothetical protein C1N74_03960 [Microbacterium sp. SGAir0570]
MSKLVALPIALLVVAALSGCASAAPADLQTPTTTQQAEVKEDSTPEQWASLVAQQQAGWEDWQDGWDEAGCSSLAAAAGAMDCQLMLTSASFMVQTTSIEHELAVSAGKKGFIATTPPAEVATLFGELTAAGEAAADAGVAWSDAECGSTESDDCTTLAIAFERSIDALQSEFAAWRPYM